ncbi:helix-turn-helix domain-containing protein [Dictyobacter aurantiacus]|nr:helix-turn-helix transcriptional regulator [Dictyobacter aurantiacus]
MMRREVKQPNEKLKYQREIRGWSQKKIGMSIGTSKDMVSRWETGERSPGRFYQEKLCALFQLSAIELGFLEPPKAAEGSIASPSESSALPVSAQDQSQKDTPRETGGPVLDLSRRHVLKGMLQVACTTLVLSPYIMLHADAPHQLEYHLTHSSVVDASVLDDLDNVTQRYWKLSQNFSFEVFSGVIGHFQTVTALLHRSQPVSTAKRLSEIAGEVAQIIGKILFDFHEYDLAWSYYAFSLSAAQTAGNADLWAVGLGRMSLLHIEKHQPQDALTLLVASQKLAIQQSGTRAWLACIQAEAHSQLEDLEAFTRAIERAESIAPEVLSDNDRYATGFSPSRLAGYKGSGYLQLKKADLALGALQTAESLVNSSSLRRKSVILADMGTAYAGLGEGQKASETAYQSLTIIRHVRSLSSLQRVYALRAALQPWETAAWVHELDHHIHEVYKEITAEPVASLL